MTHEQRSATGALRNDQNALIFEKGFSFSGYERDGVYLNAGGERFIDVAGVSGLDSLSDGRASVFADFDNDGDQDIFVTTIQGRTNLLFRNNVGQDAPWIRVAVVGDATTGRDAFGAVVRVRTAAGTMTRLKSGGSGFISQHDPRLLIALGPAQIVETVEVTWPGGSVESFVGRAEPGSTIVLRKGHGRFESRAVESSRLPDPIPPSELAARGLHLSIGKPMPELTAATAQGVARSLASYLRPGRRLLVNVWATWCGPCAKEMPELQRLAASLAANGVDLVGLGVDTEPRDIPGYLGRLGVTYPVMAGGASAIERIYATEEIVVPMSFLLDDQGVVREILSGWSAETQQRFAQLAGDLGQ